jgi:hypothetical protein
MTHESARPTTNVAPEAATTAQIETRANKNRQTIVTIITTSPVSHCRTGSGGFCGDITFPYAMFS